MPKVREPEIVAAGNQGRIFVFPGEVGLGGADRVEVFPEKFG